MGELLTRDRFREAVFARDGHKCVMCGQPGQDAHHILERRLFPDGGYYLDNGATLCGPCHLLAESTELSASSIRAAAGITTVVLPPHLYPDQLYDKWGNPVLENGLRLMGELFDDESVQKVIQPVRHLFTNHVKHPRTWHLPWSPGMTDDDRMLSPETLDSWLNTEVVVTEKMDGENTTFYNDYMHARSIDYEPHPSRSRIKALHAEVGYKLPKNWRVCGENLTAKHSIHYTHLAAPFLVYGMWEGLSCLPWDDTVLYCRLLELRTVPVIYEGVWPGQSFILNVVREYQRRRELLARFEPQDDVEGYVVRPAGAFHMREFSTKVGKYVRAHHVQTHGHWMRQQIVWNEWGGR